MSSRRQLLEGKGASPVKDIEAPDKGSSTEATAFVAPSSPRGAGPNPVFLAKVIFSKVVSLLVTSAKEDSTQPVGIITILKDISVGIICGVIFISISIFLDYHDVIHTESAHHFRNATFQLLDNPDTVANIEESSGHKFMKMNEYESYVKEIDRVMELRAFIKENLENRTAILEGLQKEVESRKAEHDILWAKGNEYWALDTFCGECSWYGTGCAERVMFLKSKYKAPTLASIISTMKDGNCRKQ